jgi:hypothetical protein
MALDNAYRSENLERIREKTLGNSPPLSHALCVVVNPPSRTILRFRPTPRWPRTSGTTALHLIASSIVRICVGGDNRANLVVAAK